MTAYHRQCKLQKGTTHTVAWIPEKFAKKGKVVKIKEYDGWVVMHVGARMESVKCVDRSRDHLHQRKFSDI